MLRQIIARGTRKNQAQEWLMLNPIGTPLTFKRRNKSARLSKRLCLLKNLEFAVCFLSYCLLGYSLLCFFMPGSCSCDLRRWLTAEESHQPFQVLRGCRQIELFANKAHSA